MRSTPAIVSVCALAMALTGSEVQAQSHDHGADPVTIEITMTDFSYSPAVMRIPAGRPVKLVFENEGSVQHEFMAGRTASNGDFDTDLFANLHVEMESTDAAAHMHGGQDDHGTMIVVGPGAESSMSFELPADRLGEWEMACFLPGHYESGMYGTVIVY